MDYVLAASVAVDALVSGFYEQVDLADGDTTAGSLPGLLTMLAADVAEASPTEGGARAFESKVPYHSPTFECTRAIDEAALRLSRWLDAPRRPDTASRLRAIVGVLGSAEQVVQRAVTAELESLVSQARLCLGLDLPPIRLRSVRCPSCGQQSILAARREPKAWCVQAGCVDPAGRRWVWEGETALRLLGASQSAA